MGSELIWPTSVQQSDNPHLEAAMGHEWRVPLVSRGLLTRLRPTAYGECNERREGERGGQIKPFSEALEMARENGRRRKSASRGCPYARMKASRQGQYSGSGTQHPRDLPRSDETEQGRGKTGDGGRLEGSSCYSGRVCSAMKRVNRVSRIRESSKERRGRREGN